MQTNTIAPPPVVQVGGKQYHVHFGNGAFYLLSTWGIDIARIVDQWNEMISTGRRNEGLVKIAAASAGTIDSAGNWTSLGLTPLQFADRCSVDECLNAQNVAWEEFAKKLGLVMVKTETEPAPKSADSPNPTGSDSGPSEPHEPASD